MGLDRLNSSWGSPWPTTDPRGFPRSRRASACVLGSVSSPTTVPAGLSFWFRCVCLGDAAGGRGENAL